MYVRFNEDRSRFLNSVSRRVRPTIKQNDRWFLGGHNHRQTVYRLPFAKQRWLYTSPNQGHRLLRAEQQAQTLTVFLGKGKQNRFPCRTILLIRIPGLLRLVAQMPGVRIIIN